MSCWNDWPVDGQWYAPPDNNVILWDIPDYPVNFNLIIQAYDYDSFGADELMSTSQVVVNYAQGKQTYLSKGPYMEFQFTVEPVELSGPSPSGLKGDAVAPLSVRSGRPSLPPAPTGPHDDN